MRRLLVYLLLFVIIEDLFIHIKCLGEEKSELESEESNFVHDSTKIKRDKKKKVGHESDDSRVVIFNPTQKKVIGEDPKQKADNFIKENKGMFLTKSSEEDLSAQLKYITHRRTLSWSTTRYQQIYMGIPVYNGNIAVTIDEDQDTVVMITGNYQSGIDLPLSALKPKFLKRAVYYLAKRSFGGRDENEYDYFQSNLVLYRDDEKIDAKLVWKVDVVPKFNPQRKEVFYDAMTGDILFEKEENLTSHKRGNYLPSVDMSSMLFNDRKFNSISSSEKVIQNRKSQVVTSYTEVESCVFGSDPISTSKLSYGKDGLIDNSDASSSKLNQQLESVSLVVSKTKRIYSLEGPWVEIIDVEAPFDGTFSQTSSNFCFERNNTAFEAVNAYYHASTFMEYVNNELGIEATPYQYEGSAVKIDPRAANGHDNSYYNSLTGSIYFGIGGVDDAEDPDVVIHELGHALHDFISPGGISQITGLSEGFSDYLAASYSRSKGLWQKSDPEYYWLMRWDGHNEFWAGRTTDYNGTYPDDLTGIVTTDGQIYSTCSMRIWDEVGRELSDKLQFMGISATSSSSTQEDAANAVIQAAFSIGLNEEQISNIRQIYEACGYKIADGNCGDGFIGPNEQCEGEYVPETFTCQDVLCSGGGSPTCNSQCQVDYSTCLSGPDQYQFQLDLHTDNYGYDTSWILSDMYGNITAWGDDYEDSNTYSEVVCLEKNKGCYNFVLQDSFGDGLCCENGRGGYMLYLDGNSIGSTVNPEFEGEISHDICYDTTDGNLLSSIFNNFIEVITFWN